MEKRSAQTGHIASEDLTTTNVPTSDAELEVLETFCLSVDGYQEDKYSIEELLHEAERIEHRGLETASLEELRSAAFIRQRELRWTTWGDEIADAPLIAKIRRLVAEIRRRVAPEVNHSTD